MSEDGATTTAVKATHCDDPECDQCHPLPRFKIEREFVQRIVHTRIIKAATAAAALAEYEKGTAWPESYDYRYGTLVEEKPVVVTELEGEEKAQASRIYGRGYAHEPDWEAEVAAFVAKGEANAAADPDL
jgi:hypothetical protein